MTFTCSNEKLREWEAYDNYHRPHGRWMDTLQL